MTLPAAGCETPAEIRKRLEAQPLPASLGVHLDAAAERYGDSPAWIPIERDGPSLSYREIQRMANRSANAFAERGVVRGSHVGIAVPNVPEFLAAWLGLAKLGAILVPINPALTAHELEHVLEDGDVEYLLTSPACLEVLGATKAGTELLARGRVAEFGGAGALPDWSALLAEAPEMFRPSTPVQCDDVIHILYTSGSTGRPKGCILTHRYWLTLGKVKSALTAPASRILAELPFHYMSPYYRFSAASFRGAAICVPPGASLSRYFERISRYDLEVVWANDPIAMLPPSPFEHGHKLKQVCLYGLKKTLHKPLEQRLGVPVREDFGMTEAGSVLYMPLDADMSGSGSCGIPAPFRECMIADEQGNPVMRGEPGELLVRGPGIFLGYHKNEEATKRAFFGDWFRTGDLARQDAAGYYYIVGRIKEVIKRSAENIAAQEVEEALYSLPQIAEAAVIGVPDAVRGEEVKACIVLQDGLTPADLPPDRVVQACRERLAAFKVPRYVQYFRTLPKTASEKIAKKLLADGEGQPCSPIIDTASRPQV